MEKILNCNDEKFYGLHTTLIEPLNNNQGGNSNGENNKRRTKRHVQSKRRTAGRPDK